MRTRRIKWLLYILPCWCMDESSRGGVSMVMIGSLVDGDRGSIDCPWLFISRICKEMKFMAMVYLRRLRLTYIINQVIIHFLQLLLFVEMFLDLKEKVGKGWRQVICTWYPTRAYPKNDGFLLTNRKSNDLSLSYLLATQHTCNFSIHFSCWQSLSQ